MIDDGKTATGLGQEEIGMYNLSEERRRMELTSESGPLLVGWQRALAEVARLNRLFCELVPWGGSEFAGNPDAVVAEVQRELSERLQSTVTAHAKANTLRDENERLCTELAAERERSERLRQECIDAGPTWRQCRVCGGDWDDHDPEVHGENCPAAPPAGPLAPAQEAKGDE